MSHGRRFGNARLRSVVLTPSPGRVSGTHIRAPLSGFHVHASRTPIRKYVARESAVLAGRSISTTRSGMGSPRRAFSSPSTVAACIARLGLMKKQTSGSRASSTPRNRLGPVRKNPGAMPASSSTVCTNIRNLAIDNARPARAKPGSATHASAGAAAPRSETARPGPPDPTSTPRNSGVSTVSASTIKKEHIGGKSGRPLNSRSARGRRPPGPGQQRSRPGGRRRVRRHSIRRRRAGVRHAALR